MIEYAMQGRTQFRGGEHAAHIPRRVHTLVLTVHTLVLTILCKIHL
jgi:hypothetical protein